MPFPGKKVRTSPEFDGKLRDIDGEFKSFTQKFVESVFEEHLTVKQINGRDITTQDLLDLFKKYFEVFNSDKLPVPMTISEANAVVVHLNAKFNAINHYRDEMDKVTGFGDVRFWIKSINFNY
jgi:atlastin